MPIEASNVILRACNSQIILGRKPGGVGMVSLEYISFDGKHKFECWLYRYELEDFLRLTRGT